MLIKEKFNKENIFFTSDSHFYHQNIMKYCERPFSSVEEMNNEIIKRWNSVVKPNDIVIETGDMFPFCHVDDSLEILDQLNGDIISLKGNHINPQYIVRASKRGVRFEDYLEIIIEDEEVSDERQRLILFHYPIEYWNHQHRNSWMLHGHIHSLTHKNRQAKLDIGVDGHNFYPWSYEEVKIQITKQLLK